MKTNIIELNVNGDPYGRGYTGSESKDGGKTWYYRGDVGAMSRSWWRVYCKKNKMILRELRK